LYLSVQSQRDGFGLSPCDKNDVRWVPTQWLKQVLPHPSSPSSGVDVRCLHTDLHLQWVTGFKRQSAKGSTPRTVSRSDNPEASASDTKLVDLTEDGHVSPNSSASEVSATSDLMVDTPADRTFLYCDPMEIRPFICPHGIGVPPLSARVI